MADLTAAALFEATSIAPSGRVAWGEIVPHDGPGVYVISLADPTGALLDESHAAERQRWSPDQAVIYIGRAKRLSQRLRQFYRHVFGAPSPHRGGQAILLLTGAKVIDWAAVEDYAGAERLLLEAFDRQAGRRPFGNRMRSARLSGAKSEGGRA